MHDQAPFSLLTFHIKASPPGAPLDASWHHACASTPWLDEGHLHRLRDMAPEASSPLVTQVVANHGAWSSFSEYMIALRRDPAAMRVHAAITAGRPVDIGDQDAAELTDAVRPTTLFSWRRPLVRIATHLVASGHGLSEEATARAITATGACVATRRDADVLSVLVSGRHAEAATRLRRAIGPDACMPWRRTK